MLILQVLKWILWIVLWILLGVSILSLLILFIPVHYRVEGKYGEEGKTFSGKISWCLSLISFTFKYEEALVNRLKVLCITVYDSSRPPKPKKKEKASRKKERKREKAQKKQERLEKKESCESQNMPCKSALELSQHGQREIQSSMKQEKDIQEKEIIEETKKDFWDKLKGMKQKLLDIVEKIKAIGENFENKLELFNHYYHLWKREEAQNTWQRAKKRMGRAFFSIAPRKWRLTGVVGFDDPSATGQLMAVVGMTYPFHGGNLEITPAFEQRRMEIKGVAKGKITSGIFLYHVLALLFHKDCMAMIKMFLAGPSAAEQEEKNKKNDKHDNSNMQEVKDDRQ